MKIKVYFNNCDWNTIPQKIQTIKDFFAPKFQFDIDYLHSNFTNIPFVSVIGSDGSSGTEVTHATDVVDEVWYDKNITSKSLDYDIVILFVSNTDKSGHITSQGIRQDNDQGPIEITIFGGNEYDHAYNQGVDMGDNFAFFCCHEITHALYMIQGGVDNTHKYFYSTDPKQALIEISPNVGRMSLMTRLAKYLGQLMGLYAKQKTGISQKIYDTAFSLIGQYLTLDSSVPKNLNCAQTVSYILKNVGLPIPNKGLSGTIVLNEWLKKHADLVTSPTVGDIIISITQGDNHGHVGIVGKTSIMSNDSATGLLKAYYNLKSWNEFYVKTKKLGTFYYRIRG